jgi:holliday junction DNA helicase RuvA
MITTLSGKVAEKLGEQVVIDVSGVGYGLLVTAEDFAKLGTGEPAKLYVYEHIRENSHDLFGFIMYETKNLFELLLSVNGVGPKMALAVLSVGNVSEVRTAIANGDTKFIQTASGVGKRVAERVVVELKDKVGLVGSDISGLLMSDQSLIKDEAVEALTALGYSPQDASKALQNVDPNLNTEARVRLALKEVK